MNESLYGELSVIGMRGCEDFSAQVDSYLKEWIDIGLKYNSGESGFFPCFAQQALLGRFAGFKVTADADPLVVVCIVFRFGAVQHQILTAAFDVAKRRVVHGKTSSYSY